MQTKAALVIGISLILCAWHIRTAIVSYGKSLERAAIHQRPAEFDVPSSLTLRVQLDEIDVRLPN